MNHLLALKGDPYANSPLGCGKIVQLPPFSSFMFINSLNYKRLFMILVSIFNHKLMTNVIYLLIVITTMHELVTQSQEY